MWAQIYTKDVKKSAAYFEKAFEFSPSPHAYDEWMELKPKNQDATALSFHANLNEHEKLASGTLTLNVVVKDLDKYHSFMTTLEGTKVIKPPTKEKWGGFLAIYESPEGTRFSVLEDWNPQTTSTSQGKEEAKETEKKPNGICHAEFPCDDIARAQKFYGDLFGWTFNSFTDEYSLFDTHDPTYNLKGGFYKRKTPDEKLTHAFLSIVVADINKTLDKIKEKGGSVHKEKFEIGPGIGSSAHFVDTEGNIMSLYSCAKSS